MDEIKVAGETTQFIVIRLGDEQYGIDIKYIDNILRMPSITRVPKVAPYLKGVINLRGEVLPVMSIRIKMGLPEDVVTKSSRIIVIKMEQQGMIGIIVDEVKEVVTLETEQIEKVAYDSNLPVRLEPGRSGEFLGGLPVSELSFDEMSQEYFDVLRELGNIGAGNATTALAQMLQCKVDMSVPKVGLLEFKEVGEAMGGEEQIMAGIYLGVEGDIAGSIMFLLEKESARFLVSKLMGMQLEGDDFSEMELSALKEVGNIITGAYLNSLSAITNLKIFPTIPDMTVDMAGAIMSVPAIQFGAVGDRMLLIQTQFFDEVAIDGYFILIPDMESYSKILTALGMSI